jgi:hypothetical protein
MNFLHTFYPSLLKVPGFLVEFITPIIKVSVNSCFDMLCLRSLFAPVLGSSDGRGYPSNCVCFICKSQVPHLVE